MSTEGLPLTDLFAGRNLDRRTHTYNSRLAQELAKWADSKPGFGAIHDALYKAYFVEGRNLTDKELLANIAQSVGLPSEEARSLLNNRTFKNAVDADWQKGRQYGITGVPSFVAGGSKLVGAYPYDALAELYAPQARKRNAQTTCHGDPHCLQE